MLPRATISIFVLEHETPYIRDTAPLVRTMLLTLHMPTATQKDCSSDYAARKTATLFPQDCSLSLLTEPQLPQQTQTELVLSICSTRGSYDTAWSQPSTAVYFKCMCCATQFVCSAQQTNGEFELAGVDFGFNIYGAKQVGNPTPACSVCSKDILLMRMGTTY